MQTGLGAQAAPSTARLCYSFEIPGKASLQLDQDFIRNLEIEIRQYVRGVAARREVLWGLLLGNVSRTGGITITIEDYEPLPHGQVPLERSRGIRDTVESVSRLPSGIKPIGAYQIEIEGGRKPSAEDLEDLRSHLGRDTLFLVIHAPEAGLPLAAAYVGFDRPFDAPDLRFQFDQQYFRGPTSRAEFTRSQFADPAPHLHKQFGPVLALSSAARTEPEVTEPPRRRRALRLAGIAAASGLVIAAAYYVPSLVSRDSQSSGPGSAQLGALGLKVGITEIQMEISWNQRNRLVLAADRGLLQIREGANAKGMLLDKSQLRGGRVLFVPQGEDVDLQLELIQGDRITAREYMRVIRGIGGSQSGDLQPPRQTSPIQATPAQAAGAQRTAPRPQTPARSFVPPDAGKRAGDSRPALSADALQVPAAPELKQAVTLPVNTPGWAPPLPKAEPPKPAPGGLALSQQQPSSEGSATEAAAAAGVRTPKFSPPMIVSQTPIAFPRELKPFVAQGADLQLRLRIDETGRVTSAEPQAESSGFRRSLATFAANAVRGWKFRPAEIGGRPVSADYDLQITIGASKR